jgi:3-oxoacyl-[acyl-carrier protein] reductase
MQIDLSGRTALITGSSKGLGLATALEMATSGANVAIVAREDTTLAAARDRIAAHAIATVRHLGR